MNKLHQLISVIFLACACATGTDKIMTEETVANSLIEIRYQLGHSQYRYLAESDDSNGQISSFKDDKLLELRKIAPQDYFQFVSFIEEKLEELIEIPLVEGCRTPFTVTLLNAHESRSISGCRSQDTQGVLGQILQQGEHLFYSGNSNN